MRRYLRVIVAGFLTGAVGVGAALAGVLVVNPEESAVPPDRAAILEAAGLTGVRPSVAAQQEVSPEEVAAILAAEVTAPTGGLTPAGTFLVGASRVNLYPSPTLFGGTEWMTGGCTKTDVLDDPEGININGDHLLPPFDPNDPEATLDEVRSWPASSPDCIYLGGFGIGPVRPATHVGQGGVWVRTLAVSNGERTHIYQIADLVGWFARYDQTICADCGIRDVRQAVAADLGVGLGDVVVASTHSHATADTYGGWGGIPDWYRNQIRDSAIAGAKQAVANLEPAELDVGEVHIRNRNNERRDTYYSTADTGATWLQAKTPCEKTKSDGCKGEQEVIATLTTYAGHPTIVGAPFLHADWPGATARRFETLYGGVGLLFEGGLGNVSVSGLGGATEEEEAENTGIAIADRVAADIAANGRALTSNTLAAATKDITHPVSTNPGLITLANAGLFDRETIPGTPGAGFPGFYHWSKRGELSSSGEENDPESRGEFLSGCTTSGSTVITTAGAHRIGELLIAFGPGEIFSNIAEVVKERADNSVITMVLGQSNDALGYIIQSFEYDYAGNAVTEYGTTTGEYEEVFAIDHCFGDHVLETMLESTRSLGFGG